jgi:hypothetical protein
LKGDQVVRIGLHRDSRSFTDPADFSERRYRSFVGETP